MTKEYYDALAPYYKYIYRDWVESVTSQARDLDAIIRDYLGESKTILDVSAGIGTQSIGLAELGYDVSASDISEGELNLARREADERGLQIEFRTADMRELSRVYDEQFDVVLSADNSIPHLLSDQEILKAFQEFYAVTKPEGGCLLTVRDYATINPNKQKEMLVPRHIHHLDDAILVLFDRWAFDGNYYDLNTYIVKDAGEETPEILVLRSRYYCVTTGRLEDLLGDVGFRDIETLIDRFYQPVIVARKRAS